MAEDKKEESNKKLEEEFRAFQVEWKKFITNDFLHLTKDVSSLTKDVSDLRKVASTSIGHIVSLVGDQKATEKSIRVMDNNILELLKRMK